MIGNIRRGHRVPAPNVAGLLLDLDQLTGCEVESEFAIGLGIGYPTGEPGAWASHRPPGVVIAGLFEEPAPRRPGHLERFLLVVEGTENALLDGCPEFVPQFNVLHSLKHAYSVMPRPPFGTLQWRIVLRVFTPEAAHPHREADQDSSNFFF